MTDSGMPIATLRFILGDQLTRGLATLADADPARDVVLLCEVMQEATYVRHHKQKIVFLFSAMRHFAEALRQDGFRVDYVRLDDVGNTGSFTDELGRALARHAPARVVVTEPGEWRVLDAMRGWEERFGLPVEIRTDTRFFATHAFFEATVRRSKAYRMEVFYREMRRRHAILMDGDRPAGGEWNTDAQNRKPLPPSLMLPPRQRFAPDAVTQDVIDLVGRSFPDHFGDAEPFGWAATRDGALEALDHFIAIALPTFGSYQDAMTGDADFLFHAVVSPYLNAGLLVPREVCARAEAAYRDGAVPLNCAEGFIRQILGWREYVRGLYWREMPDYAASNVFGASRRLPAFYWTGQTRMNCLATVIGSIRRNAYAHHIQRLMVTGNFALLAGLRPAEVEEWYLIVFADAYEWVELPNVHGMVLFADGGLLASKPYAASGAYIDRMSDYCRTCAYDVALKSGPKACPFNVLYWDFLARNEPLLSANPRLRMPYKALRSMTAARRAQIATDAGRFLEDLDCGAA